MNLVALILGGWVLFGLLVAFGVVLTPPPPPQWFDAWSKLIAAVAGTAIAARVLWSVPRELRAFLKSIEIRAVAADPHAKRP